MLRLRFNAHLNTAPTFHCQSLIHKERDRTPTHQTFRCRSLAAPIKEIRRSGLVQRRAAAPYWQADCSVSAVCGRLRCGRVVRCCTLPGAALGNRLFWDAPRLPPHRKPTLRNTTVPTLRIARAFCAYSWLSTCFHASRSAAIVIAIASAS